ncbi:hypothetical protein [Alicyclobacillus sp. ALC3]|uniref:hypothetical protein n=1 Tax=Alicyclobacillus sp. ALC3 TaxID=2796143 RepID=UPI002377E5E0|nr:hypothetical protein [Alicyclobacillus sp. ALC3]WDL97782.1 hypothetical protein JC200_03365 [Alicyclobacillus sp. ALC3]
MERGRADKQMQVLCLVSPWVREVVHDVARYLRTSDGKAARHMALTASHDVPTLNALAPYFWRDYERGQTCWIGQNKPEDIRALMPHPSERVERLKLRVTRDDWWELDAIAFAFARPLAPVVGILITECARRERLLDIAAPGFVPRSPYSLKRGTVQWVGEIRR